MVVVGKSVVVVDGSVGVRTVRSMMYGVICRDESVYQNSHTHPHTHTHTHTHIILEINVIAGIEKTSFVSIRAPNTYGTVQRNAARNNSMGTGSSGAAHTSVCMYLRRQFDASRFW